MQRAKAGAGKATAGRAAPKRVEKVEVEEADFSMPVSERQGRIWKR